ncbi:MAG: sensor histidine kinase [Actinomycetota bacterium]
MPIRARLTLVSGALMALLLVALGAFLYLRLRADLVETVDAGLRSRAETLLRAAESGPLAGGGLLEASEAFAQVLATDGRVLRSSPGLVPGPLLPSGAVASLDDARFFEADVRTLEEPVPGRLFAVPSSGGEVIVVGASLEEQNEALGRLLVLLGIGGPVAIGLASGVGWLVAGVALSPVERMRAEAEAVSASEPGRRLPVPKTGDELANLGETLNRMLGRLEDAVERERRFVGNASHELRTPLANLKAELELALRRSRTPDELIGALRSAAEETDRLAHLAEDLLVLARADRGRLPMRREDTDIAHLIDETIDSFSGRSEEREISITSSREGSPRARVDGARLRQALENLIDNALRHTPVGGRVSVGFAGRDGALSIEVADSGEGFPPSFLPRAFEPMSRADESRTRAGGGSGLGLSIVRAIIEAHGGSVEAMNRPEGGAVVVLRIPG